jgi:hypothetical protein
MSDLFLDTETRWEIPRVALVLAQSGYATEELDAIWAREILPECGWNLMQVAGAWALFVLDEAALALRAEGKRPPIDREVGAAAGLVRESWRAVMALRRTLLDVPEQDRVLRVDAWSAFVRVYLEKALETMPSLEDQVAGLRKTGMSEPELLALFDAVRPTLYRLLTPDELRDESRRAIDVRVVIGLATHA